ncbi:hypothetical protein C4J81_17480 [Deltaproteobacteria bacterium Smac51]|nr:hypothetical protein C4J81_17480 [Deltaproteobacteria bacterium Smac51]
MQATYAKILGNHTADVITRTSKLKPLDIKINTPPKQIGSCDLAVRIDFNGKVSGEGDVNGYVVCGFLKRNESLPLLQALAEYFGFDKSLVETEEGPANVLSEFLNIIIGLTGADWAEHGFDMDFAPPSVISGQPLNEDYSNKKAYHVSVHTDSAAKVDIVAVFSK